MRRKRKPRGVAVCSHNTICRGRRPRRPEKQTIIATKTAGGETPPLPRRNQTLAARRCVRTHPSLPPWGARLQATVEFCKQNIECRGTRRMRCSKFVPRKRRTPHPSCLTAIHLLPLEKAHEECTPSRLRTKFAFFSKPVGRWQCLCNKLAIQRSLICLLPPKTNGYRNERRAIRESPLR